MGVEIEKSHYQPITNSYFHFLVITDRATSQAKRHLVDTKSSLVPHCTHIAREVRRTPVHRTPVRRTPVRPSIWTPVLPFWNTLHPFQACCPLVGPLPQFTGQFMVHLSTANPSKTIPPNWSPSFRILQQTLPESLFFPIRATCPIHLILVDSMTRIIL